VVGVAIEVLIVDWPRVEAAAADDREELLFHAAFGEARSDDLFEHGWSWPTQPGEDWYGRYAWRNRSYKPHFWAGHRWEHMRDFVEPKMREVLDRFNDALFCHRPSRRRTVVPAPRSGCDHAFACRASDQRDQPSFDGTRSKMSRLC